MKLQSTVVRSSVIGWVKQILIMFGINTVIFKPNSTCSVSSSHAKLFGLSLSDILKSDLWCNKTTWEGFYNKLFLTLEKKIQKDVVNY